MAKKRETKREYKPKLADLPEPEPEFGPPERQGRRPRLLTLPRALYMKMLEYIKLGATYQVAAQCIGIHPDTFIRWMSIGAKKSRGHYRSFFLDVLEAGSQARLVAELVVKRDDPLGWLKSSPVAKTTPGMPLWGEKQVLQIEGGESPVELAIAQVLPINQKDMSDVARILAEMGLVTITEQGQTALLGSKTVDTDGEDEEDDNVIDEPTHRHNGNGKP